MKILNQLLIVALLSLHFTAFSQNDTSTRTNIFTAGINYQSRLHYFGRTDSQQYKMLITHQLKKISAISYDGNNQASTDFLLDQIIDNNKQQVVTHSKSSTNAESFFISSYLRNKVAKTTDSSNSAINTVLYQYDNEGRIKLIISVNKDFDGTVINNEAHLWSYNLKGQPEGMLRIKNNADTTYVGFTYDEVGNVAEETWKRKSRVIETYYYYYNAKNLLTDIVRFSKKAKQMLPDFILEYDEKGKLVQMTQTQGGSANYLIWKYAYNPNGFKQKETVFNKQKQFLGKIEYTYQ